jgi:hypothetical protein
MRVMSSNSGVVQFIWFKYNYVHEPVTGFLGKKPYPGRLEALNFSQKEPIP